MEKLSNISGINTNTIEGRLLIAAMAIITTESQRDKHPDEVLTMCHDLAENIFKTSEGAPIPLPGDMVSVELSFEDSLAKLINKTSHENSSDTPDFILAKYLAGCLEKYDEATKARDKYFGIRPWVPFQEGPGEQPIEQPENANR
jgi:hypothetical protein